jgi:mono/diheme cytochrome c family protein
MKLLILAAVAAAIAANVGNANPSARSVSVIVTVSRTPADNGKQMYASYCSSCHGLDGKGKGPTAQVLKRQPADLTVLSRNNRGRFPFEHVRAVLEFGTSNRARGTEQMPVWGPILNELDTSYPGQNKGTVRIINMDRYIESMQEK